MGGSPGLMAMEDDYGSRCRGIESWHHIVDGHDIFSH